jgi:hypothetical protein
MPAPAPPPGTPAPPPLPDDVPADIAAFVLCRADTLELRDGPVTWLPVPGVVRRLLGERTVPVARVRQTSEPGWADLHAGWGPMRLRLALGVQHGLLVVRFSRWPDPMTLALRGDVEAWVAQVNAWLQGRGRRLGPPAVEPGRVVLHKIADGGTPPPATVPQPERPRPLRQPDETTPTGEPTT